MKNDLIHQLSSHFSVLTARLSRRRFRLMKTLKPEDDFIVDKHKKQMISPLSFTFINKEKSSRNYFSSRLIHFRIRKHLFLVVKCFPATI